jgi:hypothetical protein
MVNADAYNGTRAVNTLIPPCVTSKYLELPAGKFAETSPAGRPSSKSTNPVSLLMLDRASVSTKCASENTIEPPTAWSHTSNCTALPVLLGSRELASGDSGRNFEVGSSACTSRPILKTNTNPKSNCFFMWVLSFKTLSSVARDCFAGVEVIYTLPPSSAILLAYFATTYRYLQESGCSLWRDRIASSPLSRASCNRMFLS